MKKTLRLFGLLMATSLVGVTQAAGVLVEAENFAAEGGGYVNKTGDRPGTSAGRSVVAWDNAGHWLEWKVEVPESGEYEVTVRYAGGRGWPVWRELKVDGAVAIDKIVLTPTGGFGRKAEEWQNLTVPTKIKLEKGTRVLRLTNTGGDGANGGANLDALVLTSGDTKVDSLLKP